MKNTVTIFATSLILLFVAVGTTSAVTHTDRIPTDTPANPPESATGEGSMEEGMQRACDAIESSINTRNDNIILMAETILEKFNNISTRVQDFYTQERVPDGDVVENYDELLSDVETARVSVETALSDAETSASEFDCNLSDPSASILSFNDDMRNVLEALKDYRLEIKDLIVAVASAPAENGS